MKTSPKIQSEPVRVGMSRDWKPLMQKVWSSIDSWKRKHMSLQQPAPSPAQGVGSREQGSCGYTPLWCTALLSACTRGVRSRSLCEASSTVFCSLRETGHDALTETGSLCLSLSIALGVQGFWSNSEFTTEKQHRADLQPNTALQLSGSCTRSNQPSSPDHCTLGTQNW